MAFLKISRSSTIGKVIHSPLFMGAVLAVITTLIVIAAGIILNR